MGYFMHQGSNCRRWVKKRLALPATLYEILQILSLSLFEKTPVNCLFHDDPHQKIRTADPNQLTLFN